MTTVELGALFVQQFSQNPILVRAPGRINIIGEHTDYNDGFVLPAAINLGITVAVAKSNSNAVNLFSVEFSEWFHTDISEIKKTNAGWPNYILGVVDQLQKLYSFPSGFNLMFTGDLPIGAGLSSSAALECATIFALNNLFGFNISPLEMALLAQQAEHQYAGVFCGIMDQYASVFGKKNQAIKLDCRALTHEYIPLQFPGHSLLLLNTNVKHELASTAYNERREQCNLGLQWVQNSYPDVKALRDVTEDQLKSLVLPKDALVFERCNFVVSEIGRLHKGCEALQNGDYKLLGKLMFQTHEGLSKAYAVSCKELDYLVDQVKNEPGVIGARMMGGGFGGCTLNIVKNEAIEGLISKLTESYERDMNLPLTAYIAEIADGVGLNFLA